MLNHGRSAFPIYFIVMLTVMIAQCLPIAPQNVAHAGIEERVGVSVTETHFTEAVAVSCAGPFKTHYLPHFTNSVDGVIRMFQANGAGIAAGDLDADGDLDLVLGNLYGPDAIFWNEGDFSFTKQPFGDGNTRAVTLVDVDSDGRLDIVLTRAIGTISYWRNMGDRTLSNDLLPGVSRLASVLNWADMDMDGDLDIVTATYDAGLLTDRGNTFLLDGGGGVAYYRNDGGKFTPTILDTGAQAMSIALQDINRDGHRDIMVANDFAVRDGVWIQNDDGWTPAEPFTTTSHSTMSIDFGDVNNDGRLDIFTTDMMPFPGDASTMGAWHPIMSGMDGQHPEGDPQHMVNVLQIASPEVGYSEQGHDWGVAATGWSWSSKFGDFDQDGYLDLYVVNGMIEERMFEHLPQHELLETNQIFRNVDGQRFVPVPTWRLNSPYNGRGSVIADLDLDGDLDIAVNNLRGPAQIFENRLCAGQSIQVELRDPNSQNTYAIGARLELVTDMGTLVRDIRAASGYLSGDAPRVHFGFPATANAHRLEIIWPDGARSTLDSPLSATLLTIERLPSH